MVRKLTLAGEDGVLVLGYPFQIFTKPEGEGSEACCQSYFYLNLPRSSRRMAFRYGAMTVGRVNLDWLTYASKSRTAEDVPQRLWPPMDRGQ